MNKHISRQTKNNKSKNRTNKNKSYNNNRKKSNNKTKKANKNTNQILSLAISIAFGTIITIITFMILAIYLKTTPQYQWQYFLSQNIFFITTSLITTALMIVPIIILRNLTIFFSIYTTLIILSVYNLLQWIQKFRITLNDQNIILVSIFFTLLILYDITTLMIQNSKNFNQSRGLNYLIIFAKIILYLRIIKFFVV